MHIGVVPTLDVLGGGIYQYTLTVLQALYEYRKAGGEDEFDILASDLYHPALVFAQMPGWQVKSLYPLSVRRRMLNILRRVVGEEKYGNLARLLHRGAKGPEAQFAEPDIIRFKPELSSWFRRCEVDMMFYLAPVSISFETDLPYFMPIFDLLFKLYPEFPEVTADGALEEREYRLRNGARYATLILADSEAGKEDILNFYGSYISPDRIKILPFLPTPYLNTNIPEDEQKQIQSTYGLPERYLFYPAQFWPHKNHRRIIEALDLLQQQHNLKIPIVFCGSYSGEIRTHTFQEVMSFAHQKGISQDIHYLGYVPDDVMSGLYAGAAALVSPTFNGPTTLPVLEAWAFGCPVLNSDIRGIREQVGDAGVLVDPRSVEDLAEGIFRLWTDDDFCCALAKRGREKLSSYKPRDFRVRLIEILEEAKSRLSSEGSRNKK